MHTYMLYYTNKCAAVPLEFHLQEREDIFPQQIQKQTFFPFGITCADEQFIVRQLWKVHLNVQESKPGHFEFMLTSL